MFDTDTEGAMQEEINLNAPFVPYCAPSSCVNAHPELRQQLDVGGLKGVDENDQRKDEFQFHERSAWKHFPSFEGRRDPVKDSCQTLHLFPGS